MDTLNAEALDGLQALLISLLPTPADAALKPALLLEPLRITPVGLGSYAGIFRDNQGAPAGELYGRRVQARAVVGARAASSDGLDEAVTSVTRAFLGADRSALRQSGLLALTLDELGPRPAGPAAPAAFFSRDVILSVHYEFIKTPTEIGGVIKQVPLDIRIDTHRNDGPVPG